MKADFHIHSSFSADSEAPMEQMIEKGISLGLTTMCFTEHMDLGFLSEGLLFETDTAAYRKKIMDCRDKYRGKVELLFGIELGLEPHMAESSQNIFLSGTLTLSLVPHTWLEAGTPIILNFTMVVLRRSATGNILPPFRKISGHFPI